MYLFRTKETYELYEEHKRNGHLESGCPLCTDAPLVEFTHWKIMDNKFPYDRISEVHHMLVSKRHVTEIDFTEEERVELLEIKNSYVNENYEYTFEAMARLKSIPQHFHLHLLIPKQVI